VTLTNHKLLHSAQGFLGQLLAFNLISFAAGVCWAGTNNQLDHTFGLNLLSILLTDEPSIYSITFILTVCKFFLILLGGAQPLGSLHLVQWLDYADSFTVVSMGLMLMIVIVVLMNLCAACIAGIDPEFGGSVYSLDSWSFPSMLVVLMVFMGLGVGFRAFYRLVTTTEMSYLDLVLLPSNQRCCFTPPGFSFIFTDSDFFLIIITIGLLFLCGMLTSVHPVQWVEENADRTEVSGWLIALWSILVLTTLCTTGIALEFGGSVYSLDSWSFPSMLVVLMVFMGLGVGFRAFFCLVMPTEVLLHLDLGWVPSSWLTSLMGGIVAVYRLATADMYTERTELIEWLIALWTILALTILCAAGIAGIALEFGSSLHSLST
jgi:hypothetical protein